jgi:hypothetical protein
MLTLSQVAEKDVFVVSVVLFLVLCLVVVLGDVRPVVVKELFGDAGRDSLATCGMPRNLRL